MSEKEIIRLRQLALKVRENIIRMTTEGGCFIGASLSCADLMVYLYDQFANVGADNIRSEERDYVFLSKGHDVPALYGLFAEIGIIEKSRLQNHLSTQDSIYWHPNRNIPGVEFHSGSLGHLPSVAMGVAWDCKSKGQANQVMVITGDGELNEGSCWEAALVASALKLDNLIWIVDRNHFQANMATEELIPLDSIREKFESFHWHVVEADGHDFESMHQAFLSIEKGKGAPTLLIANTVRGKGLPSIERRADRWFCNFSEEEVNSLLEELHGQKITELQTETLVVR